VVGQKELSDHLTILSAHMPLSDEGAALRLKDEDDVAVALRALAVGEAVRFGPESIALRSEIPSGHKFATHPIALGTLIRKYGQVIGKASAAIATGEHVHVHNVEGTRGRGDLDDSGAPFDKLRVTSTVGTST
jgi:altronate dehydratase small subunit